MRLELAPAVIVRAPAWPMDTLDVFGDKALAEASVKQDSIDAAYEAVIDTERRRLWERTAGDARFMRALLLASPSLFTRVRTHSGPSAQRAKKSRHLETALYRYLARAAYRPTPNQLWAGVTLAPFGSEERIVASPSAVQFGPDLAAFSSALALLSSRGVYREAGTWRLTPTLQRYPDGTWRFLARLADGSVEWRQIRSDAGLDESFVRLRDAGTGTVGDLSNRAKVPLEILTLLSNANVLIGGLSFPTRFASPSEALQLAGNALLGGDAVAWEKARNSLAELSGSLAVGWDRMPVDDMIHVITSARGVMAELFAALDVAVPVPEAPFRCDLKLPFEVTLGPETWRQLHWTLAAYQSEWIDHLSPSSAARRERRRAIVDALSKTPQPMGSPLSEIPQRPYDLDAWAATFRGPIDEVILGGGTAYDSNNSAPWGTFIVRLGESGIMRVVGIDDSPMRLFARHCNLFGLGNAAERWVQELFSQIEADCGVKVGDLAIPFESNPNILARPQVTPLLVEPWGAGGISLNQAELRAASGAILVHTPTDGWVTAVSCASAHWLSGDPLAAGLALTGFGEPMPSSGPATSQAAPDEGGAPHFAPRLVLSSGAAIRPRRTTLTKGLAANFTNLPRNIRYRKWCDLARQLGWPDRVSVSFDNGPPLTVVSSSPLAVEAAFQGAKRALRIVVEESEPSCLRGEAGGFVAEIVVPFSRSPHAFTTLQQGDGKTGKFSA